MTNDLNLIRVQNRKIKHMCRFCNHGFLTEKSKKDHEGRCKYNRSW